MTQHHVRQQPLRCPVCGGKFVHIGDVSQDSLTYTPSDAEAFKILGCSVRKTEVLSLGAIHVCLGCGFVARFAQGNDLEGLRQRVVTGEGDAKKP
ncbi:hypothetical protein AYO44_13750 [Planctomycetaceae bacterium SCGC AG-212-F19]|nr:hypothetical protein AYO44_13750 [Planctomycetaceae bacterium SCGC AG-212-F19]